MSNNNFPSIRILQYNTHLFHGTVPTTFEEYEDEIRITNIIDKLKTEDFDVVGLNEVWANKTKDTFINKLERKLPFAYYEPTPWTKMGSGLLLLSRFRIISYEFTPYRSLVGWDNMSQKGVITARLLIPLNGSGYTYCHVLITHTQAGPSSDEVKARKDNFTQLVDLVRRIPFGRYPLILFGDLNVKSESEFGAPTDEYRSLKRQLGWLKLGDLCRSVHPDAKTEPCYTVDFSNKLRRVISPEARGSARLDYFFALNIDTAGSSISVRHDFIYNDPDKPGFMDLSDHYPLAASIVR